MTPQVQEWLVLGSELLGTGNIYIHIQKMQGDVGMAMPKIIQTRRREWQVQYNLSYPGSMGPGGVHNLENARN